MEETEQLLCSVIAIRVCALLLAAVPLGEKTRLNFLPPLHLDGMLRMVSTRKEPDPVLSRPIEDVWTLCKLVFISAYFFRIPWNIPRSFFCLGLLLVRATFSPFVQFLVPVGSSSKCKFGVEYALLWINVSRRDNNRTWKQHLNEADSFWFHLVWTVFILSLSQLIRGRKCTLLVIQAFFYRSKRF